MKIYKFFIVNLNTVYAVQLSFSDIVINFSLFMNTNGFADYNYVNTTTYINFYLLLNCYKYKRSFKKRRYVKVFRNFHYSCMNIK